MEWAIIIFILIFLVYIFKSNKKSVVTTKVYNKYFDKITTANNYTYPIPRIKYKSKCIKKFEIAGMDYRKLKRNTVGFFKGYVIIEHNKHDPFAIAVYTNKGVHIGYLPGGSEKRFDIINDKPNKATFAWGVINSNPATNHFFGYVFVTMCLSEDEINKIKILKPLSLLTNENLAIS